MDHPDEFRCHNITATRLLDTMAVLAGMVCLAAAVFPGWLGTDRTTALLLAATLFASAAALAYLRATVGTTEPQWRLQPVPPPE